MIVDEGVKELLTKLPGQVIDWAIETTLTEIVAAHRLVADMNMVDDQLMHSNRSNDELQRDQWQVSLVDLPMMVGSAEGTLQLRSYVQSIRIVMPIIQMIIPL